MINLLSTGVVNARKLLFYIVTLALGIQACFASGNAETDTQQSQPNILLIVADDMGYADLGVHGSSIRTPRIDGLARQGILFTQFHTAPMCAPTRSMLLSGNNNHVAGVGCQHPDGGTEKAKCAWRWLSRYKRVGSDLCQEMPVYHPPESPDTNGLTYWD